VECGDPASLSFDESRRQHVLELSDIAWPRVCAEPLPGTFGNPVDALTEEVGSQWAEVLPSLPKRGNGEGETRESMVEIFAKEAFGNHID